jgi:hypothetical protein
LPDIDYPFHDKIIVVTNCERICAGRKKINFSKAFASQAVGWPPTAKLSSVNEFAVPPAVAGSSGSVATVTGDSITSATAVGSKRAGNSTAWQTAVTKVNRQ